MLLETLCSHPAALASIPVAGVGTTAQQYCCVDKAVPCSPLPGEKWNWNPPVLLNAWSKPAPVASSKCSRSSQERCLQQGKAGKKAGGVRAKRQQGEVLQGTSRERCDCL